MKKKLEAELISIAHRVLKLKNRSETKQLHEEVKKLYEQLTVLRFYEENFEAVKDEIAQADLEAKLEAPAVVEEPIVESVQEQVVPQVVETVSEIQEVVEEVVEEVITTPETTEEVVEEPVKIVAEVQQEIVVEEPVQVEEEIKMQQEEMSAPQTALFDEVFAQDYQDLDFVKVEDIPQVVEQVSEMTFEPVAPAPVEKPIEEPVKVKAEVEEKVVPVAQEPIFEPQKVVVEEPRTMSLNDRLTRGINIGLNDRIAFEKKLFAGSSDDFNRVLSQLNTFDSYEEAKGFIEDFVKPDYDNWNGKEEYENRFLEMVERKFV
ncbi:hypothetical protein ACFS5J_08410 [Flavobacterium chuncheonense]|uniref:DUF4476 domain-containing protein n=1 Tax=Flavobacterium chuncheonense TaxID=2026653 RepID=A0ABW5YNR2_9FLAO